MPTKYLKEKDLDTIKPTGATESNVYLNNLLAFETSGSKYLSYAFWNSLYLLKCKYDNRGTGIQYTCNI